MRRGAGFPKQKLNGELALAAARSVGLKKGVRIVDIKTMRRGDDEAIVEVGSEAEKQLKAIGFDDLPKAVAATEKSTPEQAKVQKK